MPDVILPPTIIAPREDRIPAYVPRFGASSICRAYLRSLCPSYRFGKCVKLYEVIKWYVTR